MSKSLLLAATLITLTGVSVQAEKWEIDPAHSSVNFQVKHLVISKVNGNFKEFTASIDFDGKDVTTGKVEMTIKTASVNTGNERRDGHLKSSDFFDVEKYPDITFVSNKIIKGEGQKFQIVGIMTMHGVPKEVTFNCEFLGTAEMGDRVKAGFSASTRINRQDFGVSWSQALDSGGLVAGDEVDITIELELNKVA